MKPKSALILIAFLVNLGLLLANLPSPMRAREEQSNGIFPCCKTDDDGRRYCCQDCCYFRWNCLEDIDCARE